MVGGSISNDEECNFSKTYLAVNTESGSSVFIFSSLPDAYEGTGENMAKADTIKSADPNAAFIFNLFLFFIKYFIVSVVIRFTGSLGFFRSSTTPT